MASLTGTTFRGFDTNRRLADGVTITALPASQIVDGSKFQITDGVTTITFEMDLVDAAGNSNGVASGNVRVPFPDAATLPPGSDGSQQVATAIAAAINGDAVRSLIDVAAVATDGIDSRGNASLNLFGRVAAGNSDGIVLAGVSSSDQRGDQNRERSGQGVLMIEESLTAANPACASPEMPPLAFGEPALPSDKRRPF
jgi:hypothetical protein